MISKSTIKGTPKSKGSYSTIKGTPKSKGSYSTIKGTPKSKGSYSTSEFSEITSVSKRERDFTIMFRLKSIFK